MCLILKVYVVVGRWYCSGVWKGEKATRWEATCQVFQQEWEPNFIAKWVRVGVLGASGYTGSEVSYMAQSF